MYHTFRCVYERFSWERQLSWARAVPSQAQESHWTQKAKGESESATGNSHLWFLVGEPSHSCLPVLTTVVDCLPLNCEPKLLLSRIWHCDEKSSRHPHKVPGVHSDLLVGAHPSEPQVCWRRKGAFPFISRNYQIRYCRECYVANALKRILLPFPIMHRGKQSDYL